MAKRARGAALGIAACALAGGMVLIGDPFAPTRLAPPTIQPAMRTGSAELSLPPPLPEPAPKPVPAALPAPPPVPPAPVSTAAPAPPVAVPAPTRLGGGKRATIIVETLPAKPIIPPFAPKQPAGATPAPRPTLPLDTEIGASGSGVPRPRPAMAIMASDG
ncbi:MAG TPA: hypothetical protein VHW66_02280 [Stellaceae bacterium]|nr:hypothetical protein [Stellaceae bacterium]